MFPQMYRTAGIQARPGARQESFAYPIRLSATAQSVAQIENTGADSRQIHSGSPDSTFPDRAPLAPPTLEARSRILFSRLSRSESSILRHPARRESHQTSSDFPGRNHK